MRRRSFVSLLAIGSLVSVALHGSATAAARAGSCRPTWRRAPAPHPGNNVLEGIDARTARDVWAVGFVVTGIDTPLAEHWDGTRWAVVPTQRAGTAGSSFQGVAAPAADSAWAVGSFSNGAHDQPLVEHWDGTSWSVVQVPSDTTRNQFLTDVAASSPDDVSAVGFSNDGTTSRTLALHWDGSSWSVATTQDATQAAGGADILNGVGVDGSGGAWAVGFTRDATGDHPLIERWNGSGWAIVPSADPGTGSDHLTEVTAIAPGDAWAVGDSGTNPTRTLIEHWDGTGWSIVASPNPGDGADLLFGAAAAGPGDVWAVGEQDLSGRTRSLIEHWDGSSWSVARAPRRGSSGDGLVRVAALPSGRAWAVGSASDRAAVDGLTDQNCPIVVTEAGIHPRAARLAAGGEATWAFPPTDRSTHRLVAGPGGLLDSGDRPPGGSYSFVFQSAGTYSVVDRPTDHSSVVEVPTRATPLPAGPTARFFIRWADPSVPAGFVADVQVDRPGAGGFLSWIGGTRATGRIFLARVTGTYRFRARLRTKAGAAGGWSPPASIRASGLADHTAFRAD